MRIIKKLINYQPINEYELQDKTYMLELFQEYQERLFSRFKFFHFTASAVVFNESFTKVLFIFHKIYNSWGWMGGHMDGLTDFNLVSKKEVFEESGIKNLKEVITDPISLEILPVWEHFKNGEYVSPHLHLNVTYAFVANEDDPLKINEEETKGVKWILFDQLDSYVSETEMLPIYKKIIKRVLKINLKRNANEKINNI